MNKLKKPDHASGRGIAVAGGQDSLPSSSPTSQSRTMMYARAVVPTTVLGCPRLTAEALLSARVAHQGELLALSTTEEEKRARQYEARHVKLETLVVSSLSVSLMYGLTSCVDIPLCCLVATVAAIIHSYSLVRHSASTGWSVPTHFTIPILSPFASVVEHETSAFGTRLLIACTAICAMLAYACFRYWMSHASK
ncbi:uncharacterized protein B0H18DRAFT_1046629 [Fomitopsis serialis]|uniref:uncharacterized protein n=1 Tax=Fomitopsis serialis TaxID=139415 RepID=UPI002007E654|nr:uncharacterized protein B0H18DRAFT_1046629 [Neoantrodia serialis]KAH9914109.1 hypothetical protein B0H18DRAFT_1046629 [Neoantrodia serialis]